VYKKVCQEGGKKLRASYCKKKSKVSSNKPMEIGGVYTLGNKNRRKGRGDKPTVKTDPHGGPSSRGVVPLVWWVARLGAKGATRLKGATETRG